ncbi:hypothetical protein U1Q18_050846 [Sarracenia purpurea var. burkii]
MANETLLVLSTAEYNGDGGHGKWSKLPSLKTLDAMMAITIRSTRWRIASRPSDGDADDGNPFRIPEYPAAAYLLPSVAHYLVPSGKRHAPRAPT